MPRRSTVVQRVIFHVERQLAGSASVNESTLLPDRSGTGTREVDVVIRTIVGGHNVLVCVECSETRRKATVEWVEQMAMKHAGLPTSKLVLVSASGFSRAALAKARSLGVEAYSLDSALEKDWAGFLGADALVVWVLRIRGCELVLAHGSPLGHPAAPDTAVFRPDGSFRGSLGEIIRDLEGSGDVSEGAIEYALKSGESEFWAECESDPPFVVKDTGMNPHEVATIRVRVEAVRAPGTVDLTRVRYRGAAVAYGSGQSPAGQLTLSLIQASHAQATGALSVADATTGQVQTVDVNFTPGKGKLRFVAGPVRMPRKDRAT